MTDWAMVRGNAITAAEGVLGGVWGAISQGAAGQIISLVQTAQYIEENKMTPTESKFLIGQQKTALQNVLTIYESVGIAAAINTINAVMTVIITAAPGLAGFV